MAHGDRRLLDNRDRSGRGDVFLEARREGVLEIVFDGYVDGIFGLADRSRRSWLLGSCQLGLKVRELAHQFLFEVDAELVVLGSFDRRLDGDGVYGHRRDYRTRCRRRNRLGGFDDRLRALREARIKAHDPGQFRERIVLMQIDRVGDFSLVVVSHSVSRTRTKPERPRGNLRPLPVQCGQKVTCNSRNLAHFLGRVGPYQRQTRRQDVGNGLHQP